MKEKNNTIAGQTLLEYLILLGIITTVFVAMGPMLRRSVQSIIKVTADQLAPQQNAEQTITDRTSSYLVNSFTARRATTDTHLIEHFDTKKYEYNDKITTMSNSLYNLGFTNKIE